MRACRHSSLIHLDKSWADYTQIIKRRKHDDTTISLPLRTFEETIAKLALAFKQTNSMADVSDRTTAVAPKSDSSKEKTAQCLSPPEN